MPRSQEAGARGALWGHMGKLRVSQDAWGGGGERGPEPLRGLKRKQWEADGGGFQRAQDRIVQMTAGLRLSGWSLGSGAWSAGTWRRRVRERTWLEACALGWVLS